MHRTELLDFLRGDETHRSQDIQETLREFLRTLGDDPQDVIEVLERAETFDPDTEFELKERIADLESERWFLLDELECLEADKEELANQLEDLEEEVGKKEDEVARLQLSLEEARESFASFCQHAKNQQES